MAMSFQLQNVGFQHGKTAIFRDLTLRIESGERLAVMGPSGVGKSTLMYLLGLLWSTRDRPLAGQITFRDHNAVDHEYTSLTANEGARLRQTEFGFALQSSYLLPNFNCLDNVSMPLGIRGEPHESRTELARKLLDGAGLSTRKLAFPSDLSGGEQQRVNVVRAMIHDPSVLFADEPVSALDEANRVLTLDLLAQWHCGHLNKSGSKLRTLILVCHDKTIAEGWTDRILFLDKNFGYRFEGVRKAMTS